MFWMLHFSKISRFERHVLNVTFLNQFMFKHHIIISGTFHVLNVIFFKHFKVWTSCFERHTFLKQFVFKHHIISGTFHVLNVTCHVLNVTFLEHSKAWMSHFECLVSINFTLFLNITFSKIFRVFNVTFLKQFMLLNIILFLKHFMFWTSCSWKVLWFERHISETFHVLNCHIPETFHILNVTFLK